MKIVEAGYKILTPISEGGIEELKKIELIGRSCYGSMDKITDDSAKDFVAGLIKRGHGSPIEHGSITVVFTIDRGVSHEFVRHRLASFMQASTRYLNYGTEKYGNEITVIDPHPFIERGSLAYDIWEDGCLASEQRYMQLLEAGCKPEMARSVLPNSLMTTLTITANYREWRHILSLRCSERAHPQIREVCRPLLAELKEKLPVLFDDITY